MLDSILSVAAGGVTGLLGSVVAAVSGFVTTRQRNAHDLEMRKLDLEMMDREAKYRADLAQVESEARVSVAESEALAASYAADRATYATAAGGNSVLAMLLGLVDFVRGLVRPALTLYLVWLVWDLRSEVRDILERIGLDSLQTPAAMGIYGDVADMILYLASTCVAWWFGTRGRKTKAPR